MIIRILTVAFGVSLLRRTRIGLGHGRKARHLTAARETHFVIFRNAEWPKSEGILSELRTCHYSTRLHMKFRIVRS